MKSTPPKEIANLYSFSIASEKNQNGLNQFIETLENKNTMKATFKTWLATAILIGLSHLTMAQLEPLYVPKPFPDRIVLNATQDLATSIAINWRTIDTTKVSYVEIAPADADPRFVQKVARYQAHSELLSVEDTPPAMYHSYTVTGLQPQTKYAYRVGSGSYWSEWFHFETAKQNPDRLQFLYFGDVQVNMRSLWSRVIPEVIKKAPDAKLALYGGDLINRANRDVEWGEFFDAGKALHTSIATIATPGNHDHYDNDQKENTISKFWRPSFNLPLNGPEGLEESCYYIDIQGVRFISLNSDQAEESDKHLKAQKEWVEKVLANNPNRWTIFTFHHPIFSPKLTRDNKRMRSTFKPLFDKYKVDLVLQGHDHTYARGMSKIPMDKKNESSGTMYVVSVSGPKMTGSHVDKSEWMDRKAIFTQLFHVIEIEGDTLNFKSYTALGDLYDEFELRKRSGSINLMVDKTPAGVPER